jgi:hypothetical protein
MLGEEPEQPTRLSNTPQLAWDGDEKSFATR